MNSTLSDKAYTNFLLRDVTYFFSGVIILASYVYLLYNPIYSITFYLANVGVASEITLVLIFVMASYFIGVISSHGIIFINEQLKNNKALRWIISHMPGTIEDIEESKYMLFSVNKSVPEIGYHYFETVDQGHALRSL